MWIRQYSIIFLLFLCGCEKYYLSVKKEYVDRLSLASTFVNSPDPLQKKPPKGQELIIEWRLSPNSFADELMLVLSVIYKNHTSETFAYPVDRRRGTIIHSLLDKDYKKTQGFLTYKAEIKSLNGIILKEWHQQLWVDLIVLDDIDIKN